MLDPEILYRNFLEKAEGDVRAAVLMVWAVAEIADRGGKLGPGKIFEWYHSVGRNLLDGLKKAA